MQRHNEHNYDKYNHCMHNHNDYINNHKERREKHKRMHKLMHKRRRLMYKRMRELYFLSKYMHHFKRITLIITLVIVLFMFKIIGMRATTIIITLILAVNEFTIIYMITRVEKRFVIPMAKVQEGVRKISRGDYSFRIEGNWRNEVGILTREFNKMASKLEEGEKLKKEYENNRKELIANISHDLKTPITSINGYVEGLLENVVPEEKVESYLKTIRSNAAYMNRLIDDLFLFSKLDMQKLDFTFTRTNIKHYIEDIVEEFTFMLDEKGIGFSYLNTVKDNVFVSLDGKRLYRSLRNLIDNAIKYGGFKEDLEIKINLRGNRDFIYIDVIDNGPGIEEDKINNIFDRFYRIDKERTKDFTSTGLGLAIAKEIIEAHGGKISVASKLNDGSTFTIKLPVEHEKKDV